MESVGFATLYTKPRPVKDLKNVSPLWLGDAVTHDGDVRLYIKRADDVEILSECLCSVVGNVLGMPIPKAYLVFDPDNHLGIDILIGSEDAEMPSLRHRVEQQDPTVMKALQAWAKLYEAAVFDEWIANPDRNLGNLLWDGDSGWLLIDQARALGAHPPGSPVPAPNQGFTNQLGTEVVRTQKDVGAASLRKTGSRIGAKARDIDYAKVQAASRCDAIGMRDRCMHALSFLQDRVDQLPALLSRHGNQPELGR